MESDLKRGIETRKSIRLPSSNKRLAPAPPLPPRSEPPPTSLRQLLGDTSTSNADDNREVPHRSLLSSAAVAVEVTPNGDDKRQLAVRTGRAAAPTAAKLVVEDGIRELNLKNLRNAAGPSDKDHKQEVEATVQENEKKMISGTQQHPKRMTLKITPLSPSLVRKISSLNQQGSGVRKVTQPKGNTVTAAPIVGGTTTSTNQPIKLSDLDGLVKSQQRRDYVNEEAVVGIAPLRSPHLAAARAAIPEDMPPLTSIDVLNRIQQQINDMEVKQQEVQQHHKMDVDDEDVVSYKEKIKQSRRYGEKESLNLKHGTSDVASNQLLGYLGDYSDNVRPSTETDDEVDRGSEDESHNAHQFQRESSVRKSTGGAVMGGKNNMARGGTTTNGKGTRVTRTASDTKNLESKIKLMREAAAHQQHHHGPAAAAAAAVETRRAKPVTSNKLPFSLRPKLLEEKHLIHQVTPPSQAGGGGATRASAVTSTAEQLRAEAAVSMQPAPRVQTVQSHTKKLEQVTHSKWERSQ